MTSVFSKLIVKAILYSPTLRLRMLNIGLRHLVSRIRIVFLRYITLTLALWETRPEPRRLVDSATVKEAVTIERLTEDMERELAELFPRQDDLRLQAVRLLMHLEESGPRKQTMLAEESGMEGYAMSRLLAKLELHRYIIRRRERAEKIVALQKQR